MAQDFALDIKGKVAVVTGAGGVLCSMFAETLAAQGAKVALLDLNEEAAEKAAQASEEAVQEETSEETEENTEE